MKPARVVAVAAPWELLHWTVGSNRYWQIRHAPSGLWAASFDAAPCPEKVADVKAKFLAHVAPWPDMTQLNPQAMTPEQRDLIRSFRDLLTRHDATTYMLPAPVGHHHKCSARLGTPCDCFASRPMELGGIL